MNSTHSAFPASFDRVFFITLRLHDALPESFGLNLGLQYYQWQVKLAQNADHSNLLRQIQKRLFVRFDDALDLQKYGHGHFCEPSLAQIVSDEIRRGDGSDYVLWNYSILPNHVHVMLELPGSSPIHLPQAAFDVFEYKPLRDWVRKIQNATEAPLKQALQNLSRSLDPDIFQRHSAKGKETIEGTFWHPRTFDFRVSDEAEFEKIKQYMLQNSVKAGLVEHGEEWPYRYCRLG